MLDNEIFNEDIENESAVNTVEEETVVSDEKVNESGTRFADRAAVKRENMPNGFKKGFFVFWSTLVIWFLDWIETFKRNKIKIAALLIMIPGVFIGFLLDYEIDSVYSLGVKVAPVCMFILVLCGYINIFEGFQLIGKKNLGTIIIISVLTLVLIICGILYISDVNKVTKDQNMEITSTNVISFIIVGSSMVVSLVGCVLAYIWRDKNYKKDRF